MKRQAGMVVEMGLEAHARMCPGWKVGSTSVLSLGWYTKAKDWAAP